MPRCSPRGRASFFSLLAFHCDVGVHRDPSVGLYLFQVYCFLWLSWYARVWRGRGPLDGWSEVRVEVRAVLLGLTLVLVCGLLWLSLCARGVGVGLEMVARGASRGVRGSSWPYSGSGIGYSLALLVCAWRGRGPRDGGREVRVEVCAVLLGLTLVLV